MKKTWILALLLCAVASNDVQAADWGPWETPKLRARQADRGGTLFPALIRGFQKYVSPVDGPRCSMYPTCSAYALQAVRKHGPLFGVLLTVDRLYHEGDPVERQQPIAIHGYRRFHDPLENNDFWIRN